MRVVFASFFALSVAACSVLTDLSALTGGVGEGDASIDATAEAATLDGSTTTDVMDAGTSVAEGGCPALHGPAMVRVPSGFCIDTTEVTKEQYAEFLTTMPTVSKVGACAFNDSYTIDDYNWNPTANGAAVSGADWCDAHDYCAWAGKRLCGKQGGGGLPYDNISKAKDSEWSLACSRGGTYKQPYGTALNDTFKVSACHTDDPAHAPGSQSAPKAFPGCEVGDAGIFDMIGNLEEWIDACEPPGTDAGGSRCQVMGGVWFFNASYLDCSFADTAGGGFARSEREDPIGFRCCAD